MIDLNAFFPGKGGQRKVAHFLLKNGVRVERPASIYMSELEIPFSSISRAVGVDRRVIKSTIETICSHEGLFNVFSKLSTTPSLKDVAPMLGFGAIEIIPRNASDKGIIAEVTRTISSEGIGLRQVIADDPMFEGAELTIITEKPIPRSLIDTLLKIASVKKVVLLN